MKIDGWDSNSEESTEYCEECGWPIRGKEMWEGGGVECRNPECGYWFCF
jgi:hypothetical protein